jgi:hypothetical protein
MRVTNERLASAKVWIGLALVTQPTRGGALGEADRAYVNVLALAVDESDFRVQIRIALNELDLILIKLEDLETMEVRLSEHHVHKDLRRLAEEVKRTGSPQFDIFQTFDLS